MRVPQIGDGLTIFLYASYRRVGGYPAMAPFSSISQSYATFWWVIFESVPPSQSSLNICRLPTNTTEVT